MTERHRREKARWIILQALEAGRPIGANERMLRRFLSSIGMAYSHVSLRNELRYLSDLELIKIVDNAVDEQDGRIWSATLTPGGIMVVERLASPPDGIARPPIVPRRGAAR
jgi:hypothetical protein